MHVAIIVYLTALSLEMSSKKKKMNIDTSLSEVVDKDGSSVEISSPDYAVMSMTTINTENIYSKPDTSGAGTENIYSKPATSGTSGAGTENIYSKPDTSAAGINGSDDSKETSMICIVLVIVSVIATLVLIAGCFVAVFLEIASLKSERAPQDQTPLSQLTANDSSIMLHLNQLNRPLQALRKGCCSIMMASINSYKED